MASSSRARIPTPGRPQADPPALTSEARTTTATDIKMWTAFVLLFAYTCQPVQTAGKRKKCPTCNTGRPCNNHVCLQCMEAGLCVDMFVNPKKKHYGHRRVQGRTCRKRSSVHADDLNLLIGVESTNLIHFYQERNKKAHCLIRRKQDDHVTASSLTSKRCASCQNAIPKLSSGEEDSSLVCSLECLIPLASQNPSLRLLQLQPPRNLPTSNSLNHLVNLPEHGNNFGTPAAPTNTDADLVRAARLPFACSMCDLVPPIDPVGTPCGHLFCWACLYRLLKDRPEPCPTCAALLKWTRDGEDLIDFAQTTWVEMDSEGRFNWKPPPTKVLVLPRDEIERRRMLRLASWMNALMTSERTQTPVEAVEADFDVSMLFSDVE